MKKRLFRILSILMVFTILLSACSGTKAQDKPPLRVAWNLYPGYYPMAIAIEKGFFEKHGVKVEPVFFNLYNDQLPALASGKVDAGTLVMNDTLLNRMAEDIKVVLIVDNSNGADQIVAKPGINSLEDLSGTRIGVVKGSFGEFFVSEALGQKNIPASSVKLVDVAPDAVSDAIPNAIDAGHTYEPYTSQALAKGYHVIFSSADAPGLIVDVVAFRKNVTEERPEDVKAFVAAWFEAVQFWKDYPAESAAIIAKATGLKSEEISSEGIKLFDLPENLNAFKPGEDTTSVYYTAREAQKLLAREGYISILVNINEILDPSFLQ